MIDDVWDAAAETGSLGEEERLSLVRAKMTSLEQRAKGVKCCVS